MAPTPAADWVIAVLPMCARERARCPQHRPRGPLAAAVVARHCEAPGGPVVSASICAACAAEKRLGALRRAARPRRHPTRWMLRSRARPIAFLLRHSEGAALYKTAPLERGAVGPWVVGWAVSAGRGRCRGATA